MNSLDGLDMGIDAGRQHYEPGDSLYDHPLVDRILDYFLDMENADRLRQRHYEIMVEDAELCEGFDHNRFLDTLVRRISLHSVLHSGERDAEPYDKIQYMINPVVKALYSRGFNGFFLDLRDFPSILWMGGLLEGTPDNPLRLSYLGDVHTFASGTRHVIISYKGKANHVGAESYMSELIVSGRTQYAGVGARDCVLRFPDSQGPESWYECMVRWRPPGMLDPQNCTYYVKSLKEGFSGGVRWQKFLLDGNSIHVLHNVLHTKSGKYERVMA